MSTDLQSRIDSMFLRDRIWAYGFVVGLWLVVAFVYFAINPLADGPISSVLAIGGGLVLLFNTAAIVAMARHYAHDKNFIYGLDIKHLDERRRLRSEPIRLAEQSAS